MVRGGAYWGWRSAVGLLWRIRQGFVGEVWVAG